jgi:hypothetical protein
MGRPDQGERRDGGLKKIGAEPDGDPYITPCPLALSRRMPGDVT